MHYLLSTLYCFSTLCLEGNHGLAGLCICLLIDCNATVAAKPYKHIFRAFAIACTDDLSISAFWFATAIWTSAATSFSSCLQACSRA